MPKMEPPTFRDKDYLTTDTGVIFKVKTYFHPIDCVVAFPRFIPYDVIPMRLWGQTWIIGGREYSRFDLRVNTTSEIKSVFDTFFRRYPQFACEGLREQGMACVPHASIIEHLTPHGSLSRLQAIENPDALQKTACKFAAICIKLGVSADCLGVTDSLMFDAHTIGFSDIDFVISGADNYRQVIAHLRSENCDASIRFPTLDCWQKRYSEINVKDMPLSPRVYALHKVRKYEESSIDSHKLSIFAVRSDADHVDDECDNMNQRGYVRIGPLEIIGTVVDAAEGVFRPSIYHVKPQGVQQYGRHGESVKIVNHRREYISQVQEGEDISAFGLAKEVNGSVVLELGSLELRGRDYLVARGLK